MNFNCGHYFSDYAREKASEMQKELSNNLNGKLYYEKTEPRTYGTRTHTFKNYFCSCCNQEINGIVSRGDLEFPHCKCEESKAEWEIVHNKLIEIVRICKEIDKKELNKNEIEKLLTQSNLGKRFYNRTFENFNKYNDITKKAYDIAFEYAENFEKYQSKGSGLLISGFGHVGTGKTHLAAAIANYIIKKKIIPVRFGNISSLIGNLKASFASSSETEKKIIDSLSSVDLLVIDDLGKEVLSEWSKNVVYTIINNRYEDYRPLIITTEYNPDQLAAKYGDAVPSRLVEICKGIKLTGKDYRIGIS